MKLDLELLAMRLIEEKEGSVLPAIVCNEYLMAHVFLPLLRGERVEFGAIDYDAFEEADIGKLSEYNDFVYQLTHLLAQVSEQMAGIEPVSQPIRRFC